MAIDCVFHYFSAYLLLSGFYLPQDAVLFFVLVSYSFSKYFLMLYVDRNTWIFSDVFNFRVIGVSDLVSCVAAFFSVLWLWEAMPYMTIVSIIGFVALEATHITLALQMNNE